MKDTTTSPRAVACIRFVRRAGLLTLAATLGTPYLIIMLFASPAGMCCDDMSDPIHRLWSPCFWWLDKWQACRAPNDEMRDGEHKTSATTTDSL